MTRAERALRRLGQLVSTETPSGDAPRLDQAYTLIDAWGTEALGRRPERVVVDGVPHLLWRAAGAERVLLLCHADTVFPAGTIDRRPFRVEGGRAYGPGVFDMKAGIVVAFEAIEAAGSAADQVTLLVTGDEETGSATSRSLIERVAAGVETVLVLEPSMDGALKVGRKGGSFYRVHFHGLAAHAGLEPESGRNALVEMAHWATEIVDVADPSQGTTVTPTLAEAGTAMNVVPDSGVLCVDVRALTMAELDRVDLALRDLAKRRADVSGGVTVTISGGLNRPPLEAAGSLRLVELCRAEARRAGLPEPGTATVGGASDGNFTAALGIPTLDGLGPTGGGAHAEHEWVEVSAIGEQARVVAGMLRTLCAQSSD
ncbi:M20 family metallopeptidase [Amycolatopsis sp. GM8]|uniref:M20 family metallopeptidase n=1 Tax=Amycolatopsis sp. GM8 TaxID=2896530 RepID=UPI001F3D6158|nr:M20 family metallopeptidase [Amycolatopsis sp. GM8]